MKLSHLWLQEWVSPKLDARALAERLTLAGLEVGAIQPVAPPLENIVVGCVRAVSAHPSAAQLKVCDVEVGRGKRVTVVCGASNVALGVKAPLALAGAVLPGERRIERVAIHGVESEGMLCSAAELGLSDDAAGLLSLDPATRVGISLTEALRLDDVVLEIELTPNRGDCLSVVGMAREVAALTGAPLHEPAVRKATVKTRKRVAVRLAAKRECPRYAGRAVVDIDTAAVTPTWMKERLRRSGVRDLHPVVDVTNYVMLELGQPMHAFDLAKLRGAIQVRTARDGEPLALLDGKKLNAPVGCLVIADDRGPIALAGVMGGEETAVDADTKSVFLESAFFEPRTVAKYARALGIQTESSQRFERGVDPELQVPALERATELLRQIAGGKPGPITEARSGRRVAVAVPLRRQRLERVLGAALPAQKIGQTLKRLGMSVRRTADGWRVVPPSYRFDIAIEADLIEEVIRVIGYATVPARMPVVSLTAPEIPEARVDAKRVRALFADRDYQEVITYSFADADLQRLIDASNEPLALANPISADMAVMRVSLWPSLLQTLRYNRNRQQARVRVFELGRRYLNGSNAAREEAVVAGAAVGSAAPEQWGLAERDVDLYDVKADLQGLFALTGRSEEICFIPTSNPALHPGQTAAIHFGEERIGWVGVLHPSLQARLELGAAVLFELNLEAVTGRSVRAFTELSRFPAIRHDVAIVVSEQISAQQIVESTKKVAGNLLVDLQVFDVYRGERIDSGRKSLALGLTFQHSSRTLKEAEVDALKTRIIAALATELGAELRQ